MDPAQIAFEFVERCSTHRSVETVLADFGACAGRFGFDHFILTGLPVPTAKLEPLVLLNGWPRGWFARYNERDYFAADGVSQWALRTHQPFLWREVPPALRDTAGSRLVANEAVEFGLRDGYVVPMYSARHWQSAVSFASSEPCDLSRRDRAALHLMAIYANGAVRQLLGEIPSEPRLSDREREVLRWTADGKTAWEVSVILTISERTVAKHLESVRRKLDVTTTSQAVAVALQSGEIAL
ncbi:helix-turn-helix transcriptional regulator [Faunimonas sp. B44]|uniref:helix-turn-helix transcriptional regulator n=1 Tax=Faunimonas sp. B44 TaxID=3461493 RepID=UPI004044846A